MVIIVINNQFVFRLYNYIIIFVIYLIKINVNQKIKKIFYYGLGKKFKKYRIIYIKIRI